jgi:hypothetical protein
VIKGLFFFFPFFFLWLVGVLFNLSQVPRAALLSELGTIGIPSFRFGLKESIWKSFALSFAMTSI